MDFVKLKDLKPGTKFRSRMNKETTFTKLYEVMDGSRLAYLCSTDPNIGNVKLSGEIYVHEI